MRVAAILAALLISLMILGIYATFFFGRTFAFVDDFTHAVLDEDFTSAG